MTPDQFCYWLQGLLELMPDLKALDEKQLAMVRTHLGYVFEHGHLDSGARKREFQDDLHRRLVPADVPVIPAYGPAWTPTPNTADPHPLSFPNRVVC